MEIDQYRTTLKSYYKYILEIENIKSDPLPEISGKRVNELKEQLRKLEGFLNENPGKGFGDFEGQDSTHELYYNQIPRSKRFHTLTREYSNEFIKHLADVLGYESLIADIVKKVK